MEEHDFGWALTQLRNGERVCREGWNGRGMWLVLVQEWSFGGEAAAAFDLAENGWHDGVQLHHEPVPASSIPEVQDFIGMKTADGKFVPWVASQSDVLATDWRGFRAASARPRSVAK